MNLKEALQGVDRAIFLYRKDHGFAVTTKEGAEFDSLHWWTRFNEAWKHFNQQALELTDSETKAVRELRLSATEGSYAAAEWWPSRDGAVDGWLRGNLTP